MYSFESVIPSLPPVLRDAAIKLYQEKGIDPAATVTALLTAVSLGVARCYNVEVEPGFIIPPALLAHVIAESGFGKSILDHYSKTAPKSHEENEIKTANTAAENISGEMTLWNIKKGTLISTYKKLIKNGDDTSSIESEIKTHEKMKPITPMLDRVLISDATPGTVKIFFAGNEITGGIFVSEGNSAFKTGRIFSEPELICNLYDGTSFHVDRLTTGSMACRNPAAAMLIFSQPDIFKKFDNRHGEEMRSVGLYARSLFYFQQQNNGVYNFGFHSSSQNCIEEIQNKIGSLLRKSKNLHNENTINRKTIKLSPEASRLYEETKREIKFLTSHQNSLCEFKDFVAKATNNMVRIACIFHILENKNGDIEYNTMRCAKDLSVWYFNQAVQYFDKTNEIERKSTELYDWICNELFKKNLFQIEKVRIYQYAPLSIRGKEKITPLLENLKARKLITEEKIIGIGSVIKKAPPLIDLNL
ncbi:hypothetical protein DBR44_05570 [Aquitalea sp. FJL05]|uniref:DUF3987 domain-containing protein n=1 Tax=Aquitalea sp. FJL05 TaxID=2153366 RepID=UPI000F5A03E1|nr:DUF3987 domain-containing protein [Aquitalea sp. FJL05]RQO76156.1 hypothetical protein DBR44_05570 [Aquitalea sp. FJL05]